MTTNTNIPAGIAVHAEATGEGIHRTLKLYFHTHTGTKAFCRSLAIRMGKLGYSKQKERYWRDGHYHIDTERIGTWEDRAKFTTPLMVTVEVAYPQAPDAKDILKALDATVPPASVAAHKKPNTPLSLIHI